MSIKNVFLILILCILSIDASSQAFVASKDIKLDLPADPIIIHSGGSILFKYPDWVLSHQILNPQTFYTGIDLTDLLQSYIRNIFEPKVGSLVNWLQVMAKDQAKAFKVTDENHRKFILKEFTVYSVFDSEGKNGHIFLIGKGYVSHFNVLSDEKAYLNFLEILKRGV